jgi:hypothetical protein
MIAIEFESQISNGTIEIPAAHRDKIRGPVRVIVLSEQRASAPTLIDELLAHPLALSDFQPLTRNEAHERG